MRQNLENNTDILQNNIDGLLEKLGEKSQENIDFSENNFLLGEMIKNYGKLNEYKKEEKKLISGIKQILSIDKNIS